MRRSSREAAPGAAPEAAGEAAPRAARRWLTRLGLAVAAPLVLLAAVRAVVLVVRPAPLLAGIPSSQAVWDAQGHLLRLTLAADDQYRLRTPLADFPPALVEAVLLHEDRHFRGHPGVNPVALVRAALTTALGGRRVGGSTLTMQLARRLHHLSSRTARGKLVQIARALQIELLHDKDEILEAYLNLAPGGNNVEGFAAASLVHFGRPLGALGLPEVLALAVVPQSPARRTPREGNAALEVARAALFSRYAARHPEARAEAAQAAAPLSVRGLDDLPHLAPHFAEQVIAEHPGQSELHTTLDLGLQRLLEERVRDYLGRQAARGLRNAAVLLVDHRSLAVKALVGSADHGDASISGQVNGALARRSPGSTLKPFVYALGYDQGVIHPATLLSDTPTAFAAWAPENFDGRFVGPIHAAEALVRSRNIPALQIAARLSRPSFHQFLAAAGIGHLRDEAHYGLSLVLGGAEVTMEELVGLYAALPAGGVLAPLRTLLEEPRQPGTRVLSAEASFLALDALAKNPRPDRFSDADVDEGGPVYWKTGTSYGFRDAWSVGVFGPYAMAVWIGDFSGAGDPAFVGVQAAAPLFFEVVDALRARAGPGGARAPLRPVPPPRLRRVEVCALSGGLPGRNCHHRVPTWFIPGTSPIDPCTIHREVLIDDATGKRACEGAAGSVHRVEMEVWPSDMLRQFALAGLPRAQPPPLDPRCQHPGPSQGAAPRITSPLRGVTYTADPAAPDRSQIALRAINDGGAGAIHWFLDQQHVGRTQPGGTLLVAPPPGTHTVRAIDDAGRSDARELRVESRPD